jgi:hypothetical protein
MTGNFMYDIESGMQFAVGRGENDTNQVGSVDNFTLN